MKKCALIENDEVVNVAVFADDADLPKGWLDVTAQPMVTHGDPVVNGVPVPRPGDDYEVVGGAWTKRADSLDRLRAKKTSELKQACEVSCRSGLTSSALGTPHTYETEKDKDQLSLIAFAVAAINNIGDADWRQTVTCVDAGGTRARVEHTAAQLIQVSEDVQQMISGHVDTLYIKLDELRTAYEASDEAAMLAVNW